MRISQALRAGIAAPSIVLVLTLVGCQQLFTTSLGSSLARSKPPVPSSLTATQAATYAADVTANRDVPLATALMPAMADLVAANPANTDILSDAVATAGIATGVEEAFMKALNVVDISTLTSSSPNLDATQTSELASLLGSVAVSPDTTSVFTALAAANPADMAASGANATQYVVASIALVVADAQSQGADVAALLQQSPPFSSGYTPSLATDNLVTSLMTNASTQWPGDQFISGMQGMFGNALP
ncbi:MAG TPA: hypothetical protein VFL04_00560 [Rectinemataceae bacterium]|nr:hypothetical protein [Rectinemataceae bacterium]